jgi:methyl-accepting chemotaxis protein
MALRDYAISTKIVAAFGVMSVLLVGGTAASLWRLGTLGDQVSEIVDHRLVKAELAQGMVRDVDALEYEMQSVLLPGGAGKAAAEQLSSATEELRKTDDPFARALSAAGQDASEEKLGGAVTRERENVKASIERIAQQLSQADSTGAINEASGTLSNAKRQLLTALIEYRNFQKAQIARARSDVGRSYGLIKFFMIAVNLVFLVVALDIAVWIVRNISSPLHQAASLASRVAAGDLTADVSSTRRDEVGWLFYELQQMTKNLQRIAGHVRNSAGSVVGAANAIMSEADRLSERTEAQASTLEQTAASIEELSSAVRQNNENAQQAGVLADTAAKVSVEGREVVQQVISTMDEINSSSKRIGDITGMIDGIAFQTNILALNAAVEAARAGDQGRGFAVVAQEVRSLAQRSATAAKEIKALINESVQRVEAGSKLVHKAGHAIAQTVQSIERVAQIMGHIVASSREQASGIDQVSQALVQMDSSTQQNAELAAQTAAAVKSLDQEARKLMQLVSELKLADGGATQTPTPAPSLDPPSAPAPRAPALARRKTPAQRPAPARAQLPEGEWTEF